MTDALLKVDTSLSERYITTCTNCDYERQVFGMKDEVRKSAVLMGWEFRHQTIPGLIDCDLQVGPKVVEIAFCPHCKLLVKA